MKRKEHLTEKDVFEIVTRKQSQSNGIKHNKHLSTCKFCYNEASSLCKTVAAVKKVKLSREQRLKLLVNGVTSELNRDRQRGKIRVPAIAAAFALIAFGVYFYANFNILSITKPDATKMSSVISYSSNIEEPKVGIKTQGVIISGRHSSRKATSKAIGSSVLHEGEEYSNGQSQKNGLAVASSYITNSYSTSF